MKKINLLNKLLSVLLFVYIHLSVEAVDSTKETNQDDILPDEANIEKLELINSLKNQINTTYLYNQLKISQIIDNKLILAYPQTNSFDNEPICIELENTTGYADGMILPWNQLVMWKGSRNFYTLSYIGTYRYMTVTGAMKTVKKYQLPRILNKDKGFFYRGKQITEKAFERLYDKYGKYIINNGKQIVNFYGTNQQKEIPQIQDKQESKENFRLYLNNGGILLKTIPSQKVKCTKCNGRGTVHGEEIKGKLGRPIIKCDQCNGDGNTSTKEKTIEITKIKD